MNGENPGGPQPDNTPPAAEATPQPPNDSGAPPNAPGAPGAPGEITNDDRTMAMLCHLLGIFTWFIGALIIWLIKKDQSAFIDDQGKEALNFQITALIAWAAVMVLSIITCGLGAVLGLPVWIGVLVFCILGAVEANKGVRYRYPVNIRFIK